MIRSALYKAYSCLVDPAISRLERASQDPDSVQLSKLKEILAKNELSKFGKDHDFASIQTWADYKTQVPVRNYLDFSEYINASVNGDESVLTCEKPFMFARTSGTTAEPKYIPITKSYLNEYRKASIVSGYNLYKNYPGISKGTALSVVSPMQEGLTPGGIPYGAMTGALYNNESLIVKNYIAPIPYEAMTEGDYESRYYTVLRLGLSLPTSILYTPNPSTIDLLCRKLELYSESLVKDIRDGTNTPPQALPRTTSSAIDKFLRKDKQLANRLSKLLDSGQFLPKFIWPQLSVVSCWTKAAASFYLDGFKHYFGDIPICDLTYCASEGRGSLLLAPGKQMLAIESHFFEFIAEEDIHSSEPEVLLASQLEVGRNYFILFTTSAGLYRYNLDDVIKVTGFHNNTPLIEFQYKGSNISSFSGEKITELQVVLAMKRVSESIDSAIGVRYFTLVPKFNGAPEYELLVEPLAGQTIDMGKLAHLFDQELSNLNIEYGSKRDSGRLPSIRCRSLTTGTYEELRKLLVSRGTPDAQIKISHLNPKAEILEFLNKQVNLISPTATTV